MPPDLSTNRLAQFFKKNWFKLALLVLGLYVWFQKDLTFQVRVQEQDKMHHKPAVGKQKEKLTDAASPAVADGALNRLKIPLLGGGGERSASAELAAVPEADKHAYLERFAKVALTEQKKFGVPASVVLAAALRQSCAGKRGIALEAHSHFALPCTGDWQGGCAEAQGSRYRRYENAWASFRDFSLFLTENFSTLRGEDYRGWAKGLGEAGFGEEEDFAKSLVEVIEGYRLQELDKN